MGLAQGGHPKTYLPGLSECFFGCRIEENLHRRKLFGPGFCLRSRKEAKAVGEIPVLRWFRALVRKAMGESPVNREKKEKLYENIQKQRGRKET